MAKQDSKVRIRRKDDEAEGKVESTDDAALLKEYPTARAFLAFVVMAAGLGWTSYLCWKSPGVPVHDELGHYFICRDAWESPKLILSHWGRVVNTLVFMPGSLHGLSHARATAVLMAVATAVLTTLLARQMKARNVFLVPLLLWFQPWFADLSYAAVTEVPFSLVMVGAACLFMGERFVLSALMVGLLPLIRHEGIALAGLCAVFLLMRKRWAAAAATFAPMLLYNVIYYFVLGKFVFALLYLQPVPTEFYGQGNWSHFFPDLTGGIGLPVLFLAAGGFIPLLSASRRIQVMVFYLAYLAMHVGIYRFGLFASGGYVLFLLPIAPGAAVAAILGFEHVLTHCRPALGRWLRQEKLRTACRWGFIAAAILLVLLFGFETRPRPLDIGGQIMQQAAMWLKSEAPDARPVVTTHPWLHHFLPERTERPKGIDPLDSYPRGTILVWDYHYSERLKMSLESLRSQPRTWVPRVAFAGGRVVIFQKVAD